MTKIAGVILAGGRATRIGGGDKGMLMLGDQPLMAHAIDRLRRQVDTTILNANGDTTRFQEFDLPVIADSLPDHPGPLAGVLSGLDWAAANGFSAIVTAAADTPFFPTDLVKRMLNVGAPLVLAASRPNASTAPPNRHPTFGLWPVELRDTLRNDLSAGLRKVGLWADQNHARYVTFEFDQIDPFFNVNTPEDLAAANALLQQMH